MPQSKTPGFAEDAEFPASLFPIGKSGSLRAVRTSRFKTSRLSLLTVLPQTRKTAVLAPLMQAVLRRGCEGYPSLAAINRRLDELWGASLRFRDFPFGDRKVIGLTLEIVDPVYLPGQISLLPELLDLVRRLLFCPLTDENGQFLPEIVADEKRLQCDEIKSLVADPARYAGEHSATFFFGDRPSGIPAYGSLEETDAVTPAELTEFWKTWRKNAFFSFFYIGASDPVRVAEHLSDAFAAHCAQPVAEPDSFLEVQPPVLAGTLRKKEESLPIGQGHLILGFQTGGVVFGDPRSAAMELAKEVLGGSPTSLLFMNVREKLSLCYSISASYLASRGAMFLQCALRSDNRERAEREILAQVGRLQSGDFSDAELEAARKSLTFYFRTVADNPGSIERFLFRRMLVGAGESPAENLAALAALTRADVLDAANRLSLETIYFLRGDAQEGEPDEI